jgi:hypothetical protein
MHAGVDERLHQQEHVRRSRAGERGRHIDHALVLDLDLLAERAEDRLRAVALVAVDARRGAPGGDAHADLRRRVGHRAHDRRVVEALAQHGERRARDDRQHELIGAQLSAQLAEHRGEDLWLHGQHHDVHALRGLGVRGEGFHAELFRKLRAAFAAWPGDEDVRRRDEVLVEHAADHRLRHRPAADEREALSLEGHQRMIRRRSPLSNSPRVSIARRSKACGGMPMSARSSSPTSARDRVSMRPRFGSASVVLGADVGEIDVADRSSAAAERGNVSRNHAS